MKLGIVGLSQSGKTTLFEILTQSAPPDGGRGGNLGVVRIPDRRVDLLTAQIDPKKSTLASFEIADPAPGFPSAAAKAQETGDANAPLRVADALVLVTRAFANDAVPHPEGSLDPRRDWARVEEEMVLADLVLVDTRLERVEKLERIGKKSERPGEAALLRRLHETLEAGRPLRELELSREEDTLARGYSFLSRKPLLVVFNTGEESEVELPPPGRGFTAVALPAKAELEVSRLPAEERAAFRELFGIPESGLDLLLRSALDLLGLITFFTAGPPEVRAWLLPRDASAVEAAGKIHSDIGRGFIRAEVVPCDRLLEAGSWPAARERGWLRTEGREYAVQDGDVLHVLFKS